MSKLKYFRVVDIELPACERPSALHASGHGAIVSRWRNIGVPGTIVNVHGLCGGLALRLIRKIEKRDSTIPSGSASNWVPVFRGGAGASVIMGESLDSRQGRAGFYKWQSADVQPRPAGFC